MSNFYGKGNASKNVLELKDAHNAFRLYNGWMYSWMNGRMTAIMWKYHLFRSDFLSSSTSTLPVHISSSQQTTKHFPPDSEENWWVCFVLVFFPTAGISSLQHICVLKPEIFNKLEEYSEKPEMLQNIFRNIFITWAVTVRKVQLFLPNTGNCR